MQSDSDASLARCIQKGDDDAFAELVRRYQDRMFRLANTALVTASALAVTVIAISNKRGR